MGANTQRCFAKQDLGCCVANWCAVIVCVRASTAVAPPVAMASVQNDGRQGERTCLRRVIRLLSPILAAMLYAAYKLSTQAGTDAVTGGAGSAVGDFRVISAVRTADAPTNLTASAMPLTPRVFTSHQGVASWPLVDVRMHTPVHFFALPYTPVHAAAMPLPSP